MFPRSGASETPPLFTDLSFGSCSGRETQVVDPAIEPKIQRRGRGFVDGLVTLVDSGWRMEARGSTRSKLL
jgi:hypothetical protein